MLPNTLSNFELSQFFVRKAGPGRDGICKLIISCDRIASRTSKIQKKDIEKVASTKCNISIYSCLKNGLLVEA